MKKLIPLLALIALSSCKHCYQCTVTYTTSGPYGGTSTSSTEFCGTNKEKTQYEKAGTSTSTASSGGVTVTSTTRTLCH